MIFLAFASLIHVNTPHTPAVIEFETIGVIGGTFNKVEFIGSLYGTLDWLQIEETHLPNRAHLNCGREFAMYRFSFSKKS
jgi:hypothetical protein